MFVYISISRCCGSLCCYLSSVNNSSFIFPDYRSLLFLRYCLPLSISPPFTHLTNVWQFRAKVNLNVYVIGWFLGTDLHVAFPFSVSEKKFAFRYWRVQEISLSSTLPFEERARKKRGRRKSVFSLFLSSGSYTCGSLYHSCSHTWTLFPEPEILSHVVTLCPRAI